MFDTCLQPALSNGTLDGYQYYMAEQEAHVSGLEVNTAFDPKQHTATLELQEATDQVSDSNQSADPSEGQHLLAHFSAAEAQAVSPIVTESEEDLVESVLHSLRQAKESGDQALLQSDFVFKQDSVDVGVQLVVEDLGDDEPDHDSDLEDTDLLLGQTLKQLMNNTLRFPGAHKIVVRSSKSSMKIFSEHWGVQ